MKQTENYNLNQWDADDPIRRSDFNADNATIDAAMAANTEAVEALGKSVSSILSDLGSGGKNCRITWGSYTGTGKYGSSSPNTLTLPFAPQLLLIFPPDNIHSTNYNYDGVYGIGMVQAGRMLPFYAYDKPTYLSVSGTTVKWYSDGSAGNQFNFALTYHYVAIG